MVLVKTGCLSRLQKETETCCAFCVLCQCARVDGQAGCAETAPSPAESADWQPDARMFQPVSRSLDSHNYLTYATTVATAALL